MISVMAKSSVRAEQLFLVTHLTAFPGCRILNKCQQAAITQVHVGLPALPPFLRRDPGDTFLACQLKFLLSESAHQNRGVEGLQFQPWRCEVSKRVARRPPAHNTLTFVSANELPARKGALQVLRIWLLFKNIKKMSIEISTYSLLLFPMSAS